MSTLQGSLAPRAGSSRLVGQDFPFFPTVETLQMLPLQQAVLYLLPKSQVRFNKLTPCLYGTHEMMIAAEEGLEPSDTPFPRSECSAYGSTTKPAQIYVDPVHCLNPILKNNSQFITT